MRESRADTRTAMLQALGLHAVLFALMFAGLQWTRPSLPEAARGDVIEADLVDAGDLSAAMQRALRQPPRVPPQPVVEPLPTPVEEPPPALPEALPPPVPEPAPQDQEAVQRDGLAPGVAEVPREQEATRRQPDQAELEARQQEEAERLKEQRIAEIRQKIEQARKVRELAEQRRQQLADARATASSSSARPLGTPEGDAAKMAAYGVAITAAVERQWIRPDSVRAGQRCQVLIVQVPGGDVVEVQVSPNCPFDELGRRSLEAAVRKASPLPYAGFEQEFQRRLVLWFEPSE
ncbi:protein TolA [Thermomonas sp.]|uniref:protein TolA n=1 Tax=Thermomonas sp. TaxID=1971895 RepID=UPI0035B4BE69